MDIHLGVREKSRAVTEMPGNLKSNTVVRSTVVRRGRSSSTEPSTSGTRVLLMRKGAYLFASMFLKSLYTLAQRLVTE